MLITVASQNIGRRRNRPRFGNM